MEGHQSHHARSLGQLVDVGDKGHAVQEGLETLVLAPFHEFPGGRDKLLQVLDPRFRLDRSLVLEVCQVPRGFQQLQDEFRERGHLELGPGPLDQRHQFSQGLDGPRAQDLALAHQLARLPDRDPLRNGQALQFVHRDLADPPGRDVHDALEALGIVGIRHQPQVREDVLDLLPLVEPEAPNDDVRGDLAAQGIFQDARLGVGPVEDREVIQGVSAFGGQGANRADHEVRLGLLVPRLVEDERFAGRVLGPEGLALPADVMGHDAAGGIQDVVGGPVVLLQPDDLAPRVVLLEVQDVVEIRAPPPVDGLVVVPDHAQVPVGPAEEVDDLVLGVVRVLVLVHQHVPPEILVVREDVGLVTEEQHRQHQQIVEVHGMAGAQAVLVEGVDLRRPLLGEIVGHGGILTRRQHLVLGPADPRRHPPRVQCPLAPVQRLQAVLDEAQLICLVVDHEAAAEVELPVPLAQDLDAGGVERPQRHGQSPRAQELFHPPSHLVRGLVGEGHRQDLPRLDGSSPDQVGDPAGDDPGLPGAGARQNQERPLTMQHRLFLWRVQIGQDGVHSHANDAFLRERS